MQTMSFLGHNSLLFERIGIYIIVFLTGASIMVIELLGTRIIAPFYGNSLYVWASLISITMIALALGYFIGGRLSDSALKIRLSLIIAMSALFILLIPLCARPILLLSDPLGLRAGAFFSSFILFTPCLMMLGMIGPFAIKLSTTEISGLGNSVGSIYAVSTVGSVFGTLLLGFFLFTIFGSREILIGLGIGLLFLAFGTAVLERSIYATRVALWPYLLVLLIGMASLPKLVSAGKFEPSNQGFKLRSEQESLYGWVRVIDQYSEDLRLLTSDSSVIGAASISNGLNRLAYQDIVGIIPMLNPSMKKALIIGLGAGHMSGILHDVYGMTVDTLEIDPSVASAAIDFFNHHPSGQNIIGDARYEIRHLTGPYDLIIHDCFTGGTEPVHLLTVEALQQIRSLLSPDGILALNFVAFSGSDSIALQSVSKTIAEVFPQQKVFISEPGRDFNDFIFLAASNLPEFNEKNMTLSQLSWLSDRIFPLRPTKGTVLTDNFNPLEHMQLAKSEYYRRFVVDWLSPSLLLR